MSMVELSLIQKLGQRKNVVVDLNPVTTYSPFGNLMVSLTRPIKRA